MILSDREIRAALDRGAVVIDPLPDAKAWSSTAPTIHAGFGYDPNSPQDKGNPIQLEIWNIGQLTIRLVAGMPICQLIFEEVHGTPEKGYQGQFTHQGPKSS